LGIVCRDFRLSVSVDMCLLYLCGLRFVVGGLLDLGDGSLYCPA
jgi:hypothetical protein